MKQNTTKYLKKWATAGIMCVKKIAEQPVTVRERAYYKDTFINLFYLTQEPNHNY